MSNNETSVPTAANTEEKNPPGVVVNPNNTVPAPNAADVAQRERDANDEDAQGGEGVVVDQPLISQADARRQRQENAE